LLKDEIGLDDAARVNFWRHRESCALSRIGGLVTQNRALRRRLARTRAHAKQWKRAAKAWRSAADSLLYLVRPRAG